MSSGVTLAVDIGPETTTAAVSRDGRRSPVVFGDSLTLATPSAPAADHDSDLVQAVEAARGDDQLVVEALAHHLRSVAEHAGPCDSLIVVVPPSWGPRHHDRVTRAAAAVSLPQPQILSEAATIAAHTFPALAEGDHVAVCALGQRTSHATVVQRHEGTWTRAATQAIPEATGDHLDHALATAIDAQATTAGQLLPQITDARPRLAAGQTTAVFLPGHPTPLAVGPDDFTRAAQPARDAAIAAVLDTLDAAAVDAHQLHGVVVAGDLAATLGLADALNERLAQPVTTAADGRLAAVYGALASPVPRWPSARPGPRQRMWGLQWAQLAAPLALAVAAALLQWQILDIVARMLGPEIYRLPGDYQILAVAFDTAAFACVGWCLTAACLGLGRSIATIRAETENAERDHRRLTGQMYAFAAVVGIALAGMQGLLVQAIIGGPPGLSPSYLFASIAGALVPALVALTVGLSSRWLTAQPPWTDRLNHPDAAVILAAAGILASNSRSAGLPMNGLPHIVTVILGATGGGLLGVGIAFTLVTMRAARIILGGLLGTTCMIIVGFRNLHSAIVIYLIAVALWWIRRGTRVAMDNLPSQWWHRLAPAADDGRPPDTR